MTGILAPLAEFARAGLRRLTAIARHSLRVDTRRAARWIITCENQVPEATTYGVRARSSIDTLDSSGNPIASAVANGV